MFAGFQDKIDRFYSLSKMLGILTTTTLLAYNRSYVKGVHCTFILYFITAECNSGRYFTYTVLLITYTVLLVIVSTNDGSRGPTEILL